MIFLLIIYFFLVLLFVGISATAIGFALKYHLHGDLIPKAVFIFISLTIFFIWISLIFIFRANWNPASPTLPSIPKQIKNIK